MTKCTTVGGWAAARITGVPYDNVDYWLRTGLLPETERPAEGKGTRRGFGFLDLLRLKAVGELRRQGVSLQTVRQALQELADRYEVQDPLLQTGRLVVAQEKLFWALNDKELLEILTGQLAMSPMVILPVGEMAAEIAAKLAAMCAA